MREATTSSTFGVRGGTFLVIRLLTAGFLMIVAGCSFTPAMAAAAKKASAPAKASQAKSTSKRAAPSTGTFKAQELLRSSAPFEIAAGTTKEFAITFKNVGTATWSPDGPYFVSVYTQDRKYRESDFSDVSWIAPDQPTKLADDAVRPGRTATFRFPMFAPTTPGTYHETFQLASESLAWVDGGKFTVDVRVLPHAAVTDDAGATRTIAAGYKAEMLLVSDRDLTLDAGASKQIRVGFKNVGKTSWKKGGSAPLALRADNQYQFRDASWSNDIVTALPVDEVKPGQLALFTFTVSAPASGGGAYKPRFTLTAGDGLVDGGEVEIPIQVRLGAQPPQVSPQTDAGYARSGPRGPDITIGLFTTRGQVRITAAGAYALLDSNDAAVQELSGTTTVDFDFGTNTYTVRNGSYAYTTAAHVSFRPDDPSSTIFEIPSYENRPTWDTSLDFNRFRGTLTVHYVKATGRLWVKETLPMEDYLRGLGETSNGSPYEFQKALVTAARTYALFVISLGGKHQSEYFDLDTSGNDQVYKGYVSELVRTNVVRAVEDTRGTVVTYGGDLVVTPYFSNSDGRTRSWSEVWGGSHPWLVSKPAPYDAGKTMSGHGVGLSANDAIGRANAGAGWQDILKYYYTGIDLRALY